MTDKYPPFCIRCKHYKPHKANTPRFVFGNWVGDGRCVIGRKRGDYVTVETDSCPHWEAKPIDLPA